MNRRNDHLDYDELLRAVVDEEDLCPDARRHLQRCVQCQNELGRVGDRYRRIGRLAARLAPEPSRPVRMAAASRSRRPLWGLGGGKMRPAWALAMAVVLIFFIGVWPRLHGRWDGRQVRGGELARFIQEVNRIVEDPLPEAYAELAAVAAPEDEPGDLTDFLVPDVGAQPAG